MNIGITLNGQNIVSAEVLAREFSTKSAGFHLPTKVVYGGQQYQLNVQMVAVGSKDWPDGRRAEFIGSLNGATPAATPASNGKASKSV